MFLRNKTFILIIILVIAACVRLIGLSDNPPSLNWDEISHGYNAYSILKTGSDEWEKFLPITNFRAYGDYPLPLNLYITIPFIAIFGLSEFSIRLPHAIFGVLTVLASYYLAYGITKKRAIGLICGFLIALEPWTFFTSRFVLQSNLSVFLITCGTALFFWRDKNKYFLPASFLCLGLSLFSYHSTRIFTPLFLLAIILIYRNEFLDLLKKKSVRVYLSAIVLLVFFLPLPFILANPDARARSSQVFLLDEGATNEIIAKRQASTSSPAITKFLYNRPIYFAEHFTKNYIEYFSPNFLFFKGGTQYQFSVPNHGLLYIIELPFFYIGLAFLFWYALRGKKEYQLLAAWILLSPIAASITKEHFAVLRASPMIPIPSVLVALGLWKTYEFLEKRFDKKVVWILCSVCLSVFSISFFSYIKMYTGTYKTNYSWAWQYGYKEALEYTRDHYDKYDAIIVTKKYGEPHEFFLFYGKELDAPWSWEPQKYKADQNLVRYAQSDWFWVDRFDKFYFMNDWQMQDTITENTFITEHKEIADCTIKRCLLITSPRRYPPPWKKVETIQFLDGTTAFEIYDNL